MNIAFYKPYGVLSSFTHEVQSPSDVGKPTLSEYGLPKGVYAAGRLDYDSEGLLILSDDGTFIHHLTDPRHKLPKTYYAQVEGVPTESALQQYRLWLDPHRLTAQALARGIDTLVFLMGVSSLPSIITSLIQAGRSPDTPVALIEQGTLPSQKVVIGTLTNIVDQGQEIQPPSIIVVGQVVSLHTVLDWFQAQPEAAG